MYKFELEKQMSLEDFNQPLGLKMNPENRWVVKAFIKLPFVPSLLVEFRKRLTEDKLEEINELIIEYYNE